MSKLSVTRVRLIEDWAQEILLHYQEYTGNLTPLPIPIFDIAERFLGLRCDVETFRGKFSNASALLISQINIAIININEHPHRQAFNLAHEIAHLLIDNGIASLELPLFKEISSWKSKDPYVRERMADYFASAILIPKNILLDIVSPLKQISLSELYKLAKIFGVSRQTMRIRIEDLRIDIENIGIRIYYNKSNRNSKFLKLDKIKKLHHENAGIAAVVHNFPKINHNFTRKIDNLKNIYSKVYLIFPPNRFNEIDVFSEFKNIDGTILVKEATDQNLDRIISEKFNKPVDIYYLSNEKWLNIISRKISTASTRTNFENTFLVLTRSSDGRHQYKQHSLLDFSRIIESSGKLNYRTEAKKFIQNKKVIGQRVVLVTGCFDLLTHAHIRFLKRAKAAGDILVVGIEDDTRTRAFKGKYRPFSSISQRIEVIEALTEIVDFTFVIKGSPKRELDEFIFV